MSKITDDIIRTSFTFNSTKFLRILSEDFIELARNCKQDLFSARFT